MGQKKKVFIPYLGFGTRHLVPGTRDTRSLRHAELLLRIVFHERSTFRTDLSNMTRRARILRYKRCLVAIQC